MSTPSGSDRPRATPLRSGPTVTVRHIEQLAYRPSRQATPDSDRHQALIVMSLTLACTVLSVYDLFLLASGLH